MKSKSNLKGLGIALGAALGVALGAVTGNMGVWLAVGIAIGLAVGASIRPKSTNCPECEALHRAHESAFEARRQQ